MNIYSGLKNEIKKTDDGFNLRRYFSILSFVVIIILTIILSSIVYWNQKKVLIEYSISSAMMFAKQINISINKKFINSGLLKGDALEIDRDSLLLLQLDSVAETFLKEFGDVKKIKIFNRSGKIVYSSNMDDVGLISTSRNL
ncbi:MAG: hypothetical protein HZB30_05475, partial [Nitrospirae bacterium]|nr:hypothetical protein [Nitrospirota bacterium]